MEGKSASWILDLCGGTGAWSRPYQEAGYDVEVITLPEFDITETEILDGGRHITFRPPGGGQGYYVLTKDIHGILAAPPCTMFSIARTRAKNPRDFMEAMVVVKKCLEIIWACRAMGSLQFWALENPTGLLRQFLGQPAMRFEQTEFGGERKKPTDIWGYFNEPKRRPALAREYIPDGKMAKWGNPEIHESLRHLPIRQARSAMRAITPSGFAQAFFEANP